MHILINIHKLGLWHFMPLRNKFLNGKQKEKHRNYLLLIKNSACVVPGLMPVMLNCGSHWFSHNEYDMPSLNMRRCKWDLRVVHVWNPGGWVNNYRIEREEKEILGRRSKTEEEQLEEVLWFWRKPHWERRVQRIKKPLKFSTAKVLPRKLSGGSLFS